ncbi:hypothetical protein EMIT0P43_40326 [Pseudomonas jessenii]
MRSGQMSRRHLLRNILMASEFG